MTNKQQAALAADGCLWQPLPLVYLIRRYGLGERRVWLMLVGWLAVTALCIVMGLAVTGKDWNGIAVNWGSISLFLTLYPPVVIYVWLLFWLGFEWAGLTAYVTELVVALSAGMPLGWALLFALSAPLGLMFYALAYRGSALPYCLRSLRSLLFFLAITFIGVLGGAGGAFVWYMVPGFPGGEMFAIWQGWWMGTFLHAVGLSAPILWLASKRVERLKARYFEVPPPPEISLPWLSVAVLAGGVVLAGFVWAVDRLSAQQLARALNNVAPDVRAGVAAATASWELAIWLSIVLIVVVALGGVLLAGKWNRALKAEVALRTAQLKESEERYRGLSEASFEGVMIHDHGVVIDANQAAAKMFGLELSELIGMNAMAFAHPEYRHLILEHLRTNSEEPYEGIAERKDGTPFNIELRGRSSFYLGQPVRVTAMRDITARKRAEQRAAETETKMVLGLLSLSQGLSSPQPVVERLREICHANTELLGCDRSSIFIRENGCYRGKTNYGNPPDIAEMFPHHKVSLQDPLIVRAIETQSYVIVNDAQNSDLMNAETARAARIRAIVVAPIMDESAQPLGFITAEYNENPGSFTEIMSKLVLGMAKLAGMTIAADKQELQRRQAEAALRESEERYRLLFDRSPQPMWVYDPVTFAFLTVNEAAIKHYGYTREEFLAMTIKEIRPAEDIPALEDAVANRSQGMNSRQWQHYKKDGGVITVETAATDVFFAGRAARFTLIKDITERKRAEEALRKYSERLASINRLTRIITSSLDINQVYPIFVEEMARLIAFDRTAIIQVDEAAQQWEVLALWSSIDPVIKKGDVLPLAGSVVEYISQTQQPLIEKELGECGDWLETARLRQDGLRSRILLPLTIEENSIGVLVVASNQVGAYTAGDLELLQPLADQLAVVLHNVGLYDQIRKYAEELEARVAERTAALQTRTGEAEELNQAMVNLLEDLQRANALNERTAKQLAIINAELEAFSYSVSHDLRAPLRSIDGFSQALLEDCAEQLDETGRGYLDRVRSASQRMGILIDDLLKLAKISRSEMRPTKVNLSALAEEIVAELRQTNPERRVEFVIPAQLQVYADANLMRILLENLLSNAWKFTSKHPRARIELGQHRAPGQLTVFVRDDGAGFEQNYADKLFGAFQRLHLMSEFEGTGIGLATVKRIVHRHGGKVWAEGEIEKGATFYFSLPV